jgi:signal peptidase I
LALNSLNIDVHPPRASRRSKRLRRWIPRREYYRARDFVSDSLGDTLGRFAESLRIPLPSLAVARRFVVPGLAQIHAGMAARGWGFLILYVLLLGPGLIAWGTNLGPFLLGLAFSVHLCSIIDYLAQEGNVEMSSMGTAAAFVILMLVLGIYGPAGWGLWHVAATREYAMASPPFDRSDIVLYNRWAYARRPPRPGDVVLVRSNSGPLVPQESDRPHVRRYLRENEYIDRLLGGPGDRVVWDSGTLAVNGTAVPWGPLIPSKLPKHLEITVPNGSYLVLPTSSLTTSAESPAQQWENRGFCTIDDILGGVYLRLHPLSRLWFIR